MHLWWLEERLYLEVYIYEWTLYGCGHGNKSMVYFATFSNIVWYINQYPVTWRMWYEHRIHVATWTNRCSVWPWHSWPWWPVSSLPFILSSSGRVENPQARLWLRWAWKGRVSLPLQFTGARSEKPQLCEVKWAGWVTFRGIRWKNKSLVLLHSLEPTDQILQQILQEKILQYLLYYWRLWP